VAEGSGSSWAVDILNRGPSLQWDALGDLSLAGAEWTAVLLTLSSGDLTDYLDATSNDEMLVRVRSESTGQVRWCTPCSKTSTAYWAEVHFCTLRPAVVP